MDESVNEMMEVEEAEEVGKKEKKEEKEEKEKEKEEKEAEYGFRFLESVYGRYFKFLYLNYFLTI